MNTISQRIFAARKRAGLEQRELADLVGVTVQAIRKMESDAGGVSAVNAFAVADALKVSARWLVTGLEPAPGAEPPMLPAKLERVARHLCALPEERLSAWALLLGMKL